MIGKSTRFLCNLRILIAISIPTSRGNSESRLNIITDFYVEAKQGNGNPVFRGTLVYSTHYNLTLTAGLSL